MHKVRVDGSYRQMGLQQGLGLKETGFVLPKQAAKMVRFAKKCEELVKQFAPEYLEEIGGVAEGAGLDCEALKAFTLTCPFEPQDVPSCTVVSLSPERTNDKLPIVGRNYDFFFEASKAGATTYSCYPERGFASLGNCDIWVGREDGLNEAGLFVGQARFFTRGLKPGFVFWLIIRLLLDRCATVDEGLDLLRKIPHAQGFTYMLADSSGKAVAVEQTLSGIEVRYPENGLLIMTNHAVCPRWAGKEVFVPSDSHPRYNRLKELLGSGVVDVEAVKRALQDHEGLVCSHGTHFPNRGFGTIWSLVGKPGERELEIAAGQPCQARYRKTSF
jgi:predicted choloylglycine hydrolase